MSGRRCVHNGGELVYHDNVGYCKIWSILLISQDEVLEHFKINLECIKDYSIVDTSNSESNEIHPLEIYKNMIWNKEVQSIKLYDSKFEFKNLRKRLCDRLFELGKIFNMDLLTLHIALKYLETILHYISFYIRNNKTQRIPSDPKPVKEIVDKTSPLFGKDSSLNIKTLSTFKKELLTISWLLIAAKFNERDENLVKINELQKECKYNFTWK